MPSSGLFGSFQLTTENIDKNVVGVGAGAYALGTASADNTFTVSYVGRSDEDLNGRLKQHVGEYKHFKYAFYETKQAAFNKECTLYHDFNPADNSVHPAKPAGTNYKCPVAGCKN